VNECLICMGSIAHERQDVYHLGELSRLTGSAQSRILSVICTLFRRMAERSEPLPTRPFSIY